MQATRIFKSMGALLVILAVGGCAAGGAASKVDDASAASEVATTATPSTAAPSDKATAEPAAEKATEVGKPWWEREGGKSPFGSVDIRASPPGFGPFPAGLKERAKKRWELLIAGKGEAAFDFLSAGVKSSLNRSAYANDMRSRPVKWISAEALDAKCEAASCEVRMLMTVSFATPSSGVEVMESQAGTTERWIKVGDGWFHIPDEYLEGLAN